MPVSRSLRLVYSPGATAGSDVSGDPDAVHKGENGKGADGEQLTKLQKQGLAQIVAMLCEWSI